MPLSVHAYCEYEPAPRLRLNGSTQSHIHQVPVGDGVDYALELEEAATLLADAVRNCDESGHPDQNGKYHGYKHTDKEADEAFTAAVDQLLTKDFDAEFEELQVLMRRFAKWGSHAPMAVIMRMQEDPNELKLMVTDTEGNPYIYKIRKSAIYGLEELLPPPESQRTLPDKAGVGYWAKPSPETVDMRRLQRAQERAVQREVLIRRINNR